MRMPIGGVKRYQRFSWFWFIVHVPFYVFLLILGLRLLVGVERWLR